MSDIKAVDGVVSFDAFFTTLSVDAVSSSSLLRLSASSKLTYPSSGLCQCATEKKSLRCAVTWASPPLAAPKTGIKTNCFGAACTDVRVKMRRVRSNSRAWIWTTRGARSRFFAMTKCAICGERKVRGLSGVEDRWFESELSTKYESFRVNGEIAGEAELRGVC